MKRQASVSAPETIVFNEGSKKHKKFKKERDVSSTVVKSFEKEESGIKPNKSTKEDTNDKEKINKKSPKKFNNKKKSAFNKGKGEFKKQAISQEPKELNKKELRQNQKLLKKTRKEKERGYALPGEATKIFEELRCQKCTPERRTTLSQELFKLLSGKISTAVRTHDLTRMIQWLIKVGPPEIKQKVIDEVIADTVQLSKTKYSTHIVLRLLKDCDRSTKKKILSYLLGNIVVLMKNRFGSSVVEEYYSKYAKPKEKIYIRQELYSDLFKGGKNPSLTSLGDVLSQNPTLKGAILKSTKLTLSKLIDKKSALETTLVSDVLYDYFQHCEDQDKLDILEILKENVPVLLQNKSGCKIVMHLLWESAAKVKKSIVKEMKTQILRLVKSNDLFIRSLFDSVDDTVLIKKAILPTILNNAEELIKDVCGRKVLLYLVAHRDSAYFHPKEIELLKKADESSAVKKDISVKVKELLQPCADDLLGKIRVNPALWFSEANIAIVTQAVLKNSSGDVLFETYKVIAEFLTNNMAEDNSKMLRDAGMQMIFKKLIKQDPVSDDENKFSVYLTNCLSIELVEKLITSNRGCFLLVHLIETNIGNVISKIKHLFNKGKLRQKLEDQDSKGAELLKKLI